MNGYKIVLLKAIFMLYRLPECERVCSGICTAETIRFIVTVAIVVYKGLKLVVYRMLTQV